MSGGDSMSRQFWSNQSFWWLWLRHFRMTTPKCHLFLWINYSVTWVFLMIVSWIYPVNVVKAYIILPNKIKMYPAQASLYKSQWQTISFLRVHWCATPLRCTAQMTAFSSTHSVESWVEPCRRASRWRFWERTTAWRMKRTHRSALSDVCGFLSLGDCHTLSFFYLHYYTAVILNAFDSMSTTTFKGFMTFPVVYDLLDKY